MIYREFQDQARTVESNAQIRTNVSHRSKALQLWDTHKAALCNVGHVLRIENEYNSR